MAAIKEGWAKRGKAKINDWIESMPKIIHYVLDADDKMIGW